MLLHSQSGPRRADSGSEDTEPPWNQAGRTEGTLLAAFDLGPNEGEHARPLGRLLRALFSQSPRLTHTDT
eukprot:8818311-Alexandrium_andersonii.AAC.1